MFGNNRTYFADSPVVIDIRGLRWPVNNPSPFTIVRVEVVYNNKVVGNFHEDTGGQTTASFDISTALKVIWSDYDYTGTDGEVVKATAALTANSGQKASRSMRSYFLRIYTEYLAEDGVYTVTQCNVGGQTDITGGQCLMGGMTELERSIAVKSDVSAFQNSNRRNGDASTKPTSTPERVGSDSITSWVDLDSDGTTSVFYKNNNGAADSTEAHAPIVLRDSVAYIDFLFTNRRGAVETCSGMTKEQMGINGNMQQYSRTDGPTFQPKRSLMAIGTDGRRSWQMSSGYVTREWAEWWAMEFLNGKRKQWWMLYRGRYVPVIVKAAKSDITIYDKSKQQMPHVDFTVTLALEG